MSLLSGLVVVVDEHTIVSRYAVRRWRRGLLGFAAGAFVVMWYPTAAAGAEAAPADPSAGLEEIVVSAQRVTQSAREVPISITTFSPADFGVLDIRSETDLELATPDLTFTQQSGYARNYIRGIGSAYPSIGLESSVATYIDGAYLERAFGTIFDFLDPASVEVLKGPQGTLYGRNATGGTILVNTADPTDKFEGHVTAEGGNLGHGLAEAVVNIPLASTFALRVAARVDQDGAYIHNLYNGTKLGSQTLTQERIKLRWTPSDALTAVLGVEHVDTRQYDTIYTDRAPSPQCLACPIPGSYAPVTGFYNTSTDENRPGVFINTLSTLHIDYNVDNLKFRSVTTYREDYGTLAPDLDATAIPIIVFPFIYRGNTATQDFQLSTSSPGWINGLAAISYLHDNGKFSSTEIGEAFAPLVQAGLPDPAGYNAVVTKSTAGVLEAYVTPVAGLKVTLGGRYTHESRSLSTYDNLGTVVADGIPAGTPDPFTQDVAFSNFTPRFVVAYDFDAVNVYASFNKGFKAGGFNEPTFAYQAAIRPERVDSYEIGAKYLSADRSVRANVAVFHYTYSDLQVSVTDLATGGQSILNAASAKGDGFESDIQYLPAPWVELSAGAAYLNAHFTKFPNASVVGVSPSGGLVQTTEDLSGFPLAQAPRFTGNLAARFKKDWTGWTGDLNTILKYTSEYDFFPGAGGPIGFDRQPPYALVNLTANAGPTGGSYKLGLYIDNLTNRKYYLVQSTEAPFARYNSPAPPITFGARITYTW